MDIILSFPWIILSSLLFRIIHPTVALSSTSTSFRLSSVQRSISCVARRSHHQNKIPFLPFTMIRRRRRPSPISSSISATLLRSASSSDGYDDDQFQDDDCSPAGGKEEVSNKTNNLFNRGIYFGAWGQPVYEKTVPLSLPNNNNNNKTSTRRHVWVQVHAVGINPVDAKHVIGDKLKHDWVTLRKWAHQTIVRDTRVGFDFAGVVVVGDDKKKYPKGTRVFGCMPPLQGSCAEYVKVPLHQIAVAPNNLTMAESAALPLVGLTAWQALSPHITTINTTMKQQPPRVLVIGGSSGTGHVALQVAKALGTSDLVTICSARSVDFVKECGATRVVDYTEPWSSQDEMAKELFCDGPFDLILDCVTSADPTDAQHGYPALVQRYQQRLQSNHGNDDPHKYSGKNSPNSYLYQRLGGKWTGWIRAGMARFLPNSMQKWVWKDSRERLFWIRFPYSSRELQELAQLADQGALKPKIQKSYKEFSAATIQQAFDDIMSRRVKGKIVVEVISDNDSNK